MRSASSPHTLSIHFFVGFPWGRELLLTCFACLMLLGTGVAAAKPQELKAVRSVEGIAEYTLPNGLQVLLAPDDSKPTTTVNLTLRVGSRHESYGETGMAHLLEHLLFKGSKRHPNAWAEFTKRGLRSNGSTWLDRTNYFASFASSDANLTWYLDWLADAMVNSFIARKDLDSEMTVVRNEMEMGENSPGRILFEKTLAAMYQWHNYGKSTIGARTDVEQVDIQRLRAFYRTWYRPDNATLIVSGKFDPDRVKALVGLHFGRIAKPAQPMPRLYTLDPVQDGERELTLRRVGGAPSLMVGYHGVPGAHPDQAAAEVLALAMGEAPFGRLHKRLTQRELAASTWAWTAGLHDPGFVLFGVELGPTQDVGAARQALLQTLESVSTEPFSQEELDRARVRWLKVWDQAYADPEQVGVALSESVAQGDWRLFFLLRDRVRELKLEDLQRFSARHLLPSNRTLGQFIPTAQPQRAPAPAAVDLAQQLRSFQPAAAPTAAEAFEASAQAVEARTSRSQVQGLRIALLPKATRGKVVQARLRLHVGDEASLKAQASTAEFMAALLDKGSRSLGRQQVQDRLDALRAELGFTFARGVLTAQMQARRESLPALIDLVAGLLKEPAFEAEVLEELRRQAQAALEQARKEPESIVEEALGRHGNPYARGDLRHGRSFDEVAADLAAVNVQAVRALHQGIVGAARAEFAAVGDFEPQAVRAALERAFGNWSAPVAPRRLAQPGWEAPAVRLEFRTPDKQNATLLVRQHLPLGERDADQPALLLANFLLGQGGNSRLWVRIREKGGLSYDVRSWIDWNPHEPGSRWNASAIFAPANKAAVETALREEIDRALKLGFSDKEVAEGKSALLSFRRLALAQDARLAGTLTQQLELGETMAWHARVDAAIRALTPAQVNAALRTYIRPQAFSIALAGDFR